MAGIVTPRVVRRIAGEYTDVDERGAVGIRLEPAAAIEPARHRPAAMPTAIWIDTS